MMVQIRSAEELQQVEEPEAPRTSTTNMPVFGDGGSGVSEADVQAQEEARRSGARKTAAVRAARPEDRSQRSVSVRLRQEIQALPRQVDLEGGTVS